MNRRPHTHQARRVCTHMRGLRCPYHLGPVYRPRCHHLIEGIKMRAIPISNYTNLHKPIIPGDDCLCFSDYDTLKISIDKALIMSDEEINSKQKNLEKFYNQVLSPSSFLESFKRRTNNEILACNDVESLNWLN